MKKLLAVLISLTLLCGMALPAWAEGPVKDETVYILAEPDGTARRVIVSDWLSNPDGEERLADESLLTDIENVKGAEAFDGSFWQAEGRDIYYQGESTQPLPVEMTITYALDGQDISPENLAGQSGHVRIRFDYQVNRSVSAQINGQTETLSVPYMVLTALLLENDVFANVEAANACIVNDGDRTIVAGLALPGLQQSLNLDSDTLSLPGYVEMEADVTNFALPVTVSAATSQVFALLDADQLNDTDDLKDSVTELVDGMAQLLDGATQLSDGLIDLGTGADQLAEGVTALSDGLNTLIANNEALISGSTQVFETLLATANQQLAASGAEVPTLTMDNYAETLSTLIDSMSEDGIVEQAQAKVEEAVRAKEEQVRAAVTQAVQAEVQAQVEAAVQQSVLAQVLAAVGLTEESYAAAKGTDQLPAEQAVQIEAAVRQQLASEEVKALTAQQLEAQLASDEVQALIAQNTEEQLLALIQQNMESSDVQKQIEQSVQQYQAACATLTALKDQLDSYNAFHTGLTAYTEGAASAADGAVQLKDNLPALQDGIGKLQEGALALKDGLTTFDTEGIDKLDDLVNVDLEALLARMRSLIRGAQDDQSYSGIAEATEGAVRYIWRTDAIQP